MRESLRQRLETQIAYETILKKSTKLEYPHIIKLGAMLCVEAGKEPDPARINECKQILKHKVNLLSSFRSHMERLVLIKMSLADDAEAYIDGVLAVHKLLSEGFMLDHDQLAMAATTIYENCPAEETEAVVNRTREAYQLMKQQHRFLTGTEDMALISLLIMAGMRPQDATRRTEELYQLLRQDHVAGIEAAQPSALVLALSDKPAPQKVRDFHDLHQACKEAKCATSRDISMAIYATFADINVPHNQIAHEIAEVDEFLKGKKDYGVFGVGGSIRHLIAAANVIEDLQSDAAPHAVSMTSAVTQAIVEELLIILITIIITSAIMASSHAAHSGNH